MRKMLLLAMGMLLLCAQVSAQSRTISGKITDNTGSPVPNASITVKGTSIGTTSGPDGSFSFSVPTTAKQVEVSSVGFALQSFDITRSGVLSISLSNAASEIAEVVVTGYSREKRAQFTGAATQLSGKVVETVPVGSFEQALQGRAPGLLINSGSGQPGTSANINIRGIHSITGAFAQPLIVMDGVPLPAADLQTINPNDFESITVLKDGSAAALYGARGGLGVIVITTKKGKAGTSNFGYRTQFGVTEPPNWNKFDMMNTREILQYEEWLGSEGFTTNTPGWVYSPLNPTYATATPAEQALRDHLLDSISQIYTDYCDILFRNGFSQLHEINLSGGSDKTRFFLSAGLFDQEGTDLRSRLKRYTARFNIDHTTGKLNLSFNTLAGYSITNFSEGEFLGNSARNSFQMAWRSKPYENPYKPDGTLNYGTNTTLALKQVANVLEGMENSLWTQHQIKINSGLTLAYKLFDWLTVKNTLGIDMSQDRFQHWIKAGSFYGSTSANGGNGIDQESSRITTQLINTTGAMFSNRFGGVHEVEAGAFFEVVQGFQKSLGFTLYNLDPRLGPTGQGAGTLPTATTAQFGSSARTEYGIRSYFATAKYTYDSRYTLTANVRRDGTSRIANTQNNEITTWSAGFSWNAMEENFMKNQNILTEWRMRFSYGAVPNIGSISTGTFGVTLANVTNYLGPQVPAYGVGGNYSGVNITGQVPTTPGNPNLKIETIQKFNLGTDFSVWRSRARFIIDAYYDKTVDLFVSQGIPVTTGFGTPSTIPINAGVMTNKGLEFTASVDVVKSKDYLVTLGINHSININKIEDLGQVNEIPSGTFVIREGLPYGSHYATHYLGADPATGAPVFEKEDGSSTTDPGQAFLFAKFGTFLPKHQGGLSLDFKWKRLTLSALFSYQFDVRRYNNIENWVTRGITGYHASVNASRRLLTEQWQKPGDEKFYQYPAYDRGFSSSDVQDAKFMRFRNLVVAYQIPELSIAGKRLIKTARIYVQGQNLAIWSPWRGPDPEDNNNISLNEFPNTRMFVAGIDINF
jgi:TonB-linked SusC/RagA family outer membrane protein